MYRRAYQGWVKHLDFIILDVLCLQAAFAAAYMLRHGLRSPYEDLIYRNISLILILIDVLVLLGANSFKNVLKRGNLRELKHSVRHAVLVVVTASFYLFATQTGGSYSRLTFFYMGGLYALFTFIARIIWKNRMRSAIRSREREKSMLVVTTRERAESLLENLQSDDLRSFSVTGVICIDRDCRGEIIGGVPVAALLFDKLRLPGKKVACLVSGGNIDVNILSRVINRGLLTSGRLSDLTIAMHDKPGELKRVSAIIADLGANVIKVRHNLSVENMEINSCFLHISMETKNRQHLLDIEHALQEAGYVIQK